MPALKWDETDVMECLEVVPEIEEYQVSHTYEVVKSGIHLRLQLWQFESMLEIALSNEVDGNIITSYAVMVRDKIKHVKEGSVEYLLFKNCLVLPSRFSYLDLGGVHKLEISDVGFNLKLSVNPSIRIEYLRENT